MGHLTDSVNIACDFWSHGHPVQHTVYLKKKLIQYKSALRQLQKPNIFVFGATEEQIIEGKKIGNWKKC